MTRIIVNRNRDDIDVSDRINRIRLRRLLQQVQDVKGYSDDQLSTLAGYKEKWLSSLWARKSWRLATVQHVARTLGYRLVFNVAIDLSDVGLTVEDLAVEDLQSLYTDPAKQDEAARIELTALGARIREAVGLTPPQLGKRLNMEGHKISIFESGEKPYYLLVTAQRYFRALGGELQFSLVDDEGNVLRPTADEDSEAIVAKTWKGTGEQVRVNIFAGHVFLWNSLTPSNVVSFPVPVWRQFVKQLGGTSIDGLRRLDFDELGDQSDDDFDSE